MIIKVYKPWGHEEVLVHNGKYVIKKLFVKGKQRLSLQSHKVKLETLMIYGGKGIMTLGDRKFEYDIRDIRSLPKIVDISIPGTIHRVEAIKDTTIYEVSTPELDDVIRLEDDYGRA